MQSGESTPPRGYSSGPQLMQNWMKIFRVLELKQNIFPVVVGMVLFLVSLSSLFSPLSSFSPSPPSPLSISPSLLSFFLPMLPNAYLLSVEFCWDLLLSLSLSSFFLFECVNVSWKKNVMNSVTNCLYFKNRSPHMIGLNLNQRWNQTKHNWYQAGII